VRKIEKDDHRKFLREKKKNSNTDRIRVKKMGERR
jgi:hypothetical protein